jgi:ubiquinone/menaquinone biosynthesis C-methylase UbiE
LQGGYKKRDGRTNVRRTFGRQRQNLTELRIPQSVRGCIATPARTTVAAAERETLMYDDELRSRKYYEGRARLYDWANRSAALLRGTSGRTQRLTAIGRLNLTAGDRVLEVSAGTGTNLDLMSEALSGHGSLIGLDISRSMLLRARQKPSLNAPSVALVEGEAAHLPFRDGEFDAVFHHGGIAEFGDRRGALAEMVRVARPGARVVVCDVGVPTDRKLSLINRLLMMTQPVYRKPPPIDLLPAAAQDVHLGWIGGGAWYLIHFTKAPG